jgi:hypothetical protein
MPIITTQTGNVFIDKIISCSGLSINYRLYIKMLQAPDTLKIEEEAVETEEKRFQYRNKVVLEGCHGERISLYVNGESIDLDNTKQAIELKNAISSFLSTRKYNKIIKKNQSDKKSLTVTVKVDDYAYFEDIKKADLQLMLDLLKAFCPPK